jgi:hypothetical protein
MDMKIFEKMDASVLKNYIQFLIWHYQVMDSFWYLFITEKFCQPVADELNGKVWGHISGMGAKDLIQRFKIKGQGLSRFLKVLQYWPWTIIVGYQIEEKENEVIITVPSCPTQEARLRRGLDEYACKEMHRAEFTGFSNQIDPRIKVECLFAPPDAHPTDLFCKWRFTLKE